MDGKIVMGVGKLRPLDPSFAPSDGQLFFWNLRAGLGYSVGLSRQSVMTSVRAKCAVEFLGFQQSTNGADTFVFCDASLFATF
jgi:hypothetical protein